jgi:hypothetical protein
MKYRFFKLAKLICFIFINIWLLASCVDLFDAGLNTNKRKLVVDGEITNKPGPYFVTLQQSSPFGTSEFAPPPFNATVIITDNAGNSETLTDKGNGKFEANIIQGVIGRAYTLEVRIGDKRIYRSTPQTIKRPVKVEKIYTEYVPYNFTPEVYSGGEFHVYLDTQDPATTGDYYRWNYTNYEKLDYCKETILVNDAGRIYNQFNCCEPCWAINYCPGCIYLGSDQFNNGKKIKRQFIGKFPYNSISPVFLQIEQKAITKENYFYWREIDGQINNSGGIFDTPPNNIQGNITSISDPTEQVLGFFAASGVEVVPYFVDKKSDGFNPVIRKRFDFVTQSGCEPCQEGLYRTKVRPNGF